MPHIPFAEIRFFDPSENRVTLEDRFENHLRRLRGYLPFAQSGGQLLFHLISKLYEQLARLDRIERCNTL
jgi:hypothetical protein